MRGSVRIEAPAKINLRLAVLARETTGYHSLETLFCGVSLHDVIEVTPSDPGVSLEAVGDVEMGPARDNLIVRAARRFYAEIEVPPAVALRVEKRIPAAAGLGGGSADAGATLRALNALHGEPLTRATLIECGAQLGSDVPFFLSETPYALAWGRGQRILSLPPLPRRSVLIARPDVDMPTPAVFRRLSELREGAPPPGGNEIALDRLLDWESIPEIAGNDFDPVAREWIPRFAEACHLMTRFGAPVASLAGSGSSIFGIFPSPETLRQARDAIEEFGFVTWSAETLEAWPAPSPKD